ncbi:MAG: NfeD family protein [Candidatus Aenigmatarchaeota archaeon]
MKKLTFLIFLIFISYSFSSNFLVIKIDKEISFSTKEYVKNALEKAKNKNFDALIILIDTPGGNFEATFEIIKMIDRSEIPVISFVYPKGAVAWSAGTFVLLSSHLAIMSNHSLVGSAQPIIISEEGIKGINESKIINAIVSLLEERMKMYNRNYSLVKLFVLENLNLNAEEALKLNAIDLIANSLEELLNKIDGKIIGNKIIDTKNYKIEEFGGIKFDLLEKFSQPLISSILLIIGIYALIFGLTNPGYFAEIIGGILIILSLIGFGFEINSISIILIIIGIALILYEIFFTVSFGAFCIVGIILVSLGVILSSPLNFSKIENLIALVVISSISSIFFILITASIIKTKRREPFQKMIGKIGIALDNLSENKEGYIKVEGELWKAMGKREIKKNEKVVIIEKRDNLFLVEKYSIYEKGKKRK